MWTFVQVVRIESNWGRWAALVTLSKGGVPESFWVLNSPTEPTTAQATVAGQALADAFNTQLAKAEFEATLGL